LVNAAAFTAVDRAETEFFEANSVNAIFAGKLAQAAAQADVRLMQISTDYVFDGNATQPYKVTDQVNPQTAYGESKALGERLVAESGADYSILRTAWLYSVGGKNFANTIASILKSNGEARVVDDQIGQPTWAADLARVVFDVAQLNEMPRIVHAVSSGSGSWADFAREIAETLGLPRESVIAVSSAEFETAAKRPAYSVLDNSSSVIEPIGDWRERWRVAAPGVLQEFR
jgi:dTDP-4-dehydrorhamnose reductase